MTFAHGAKDRLTTYDLGRFAGTTLFDRLGRAVCRAGVLPRKELYEAWEVARRVRRRCRGGRVVDVAGGHGLLAFVMLLLDDTSPEAVVVDPTRPPSADALAATLCGEWPRLAARVSWRTTTLDTVSLAADDVVVSSHACGVLTDRVIDAATAVRAPLAVLPCCHDAATCDPGPLRGWMDLALAVDSLRAVRLADRAYRVWTQAIPVDITPKHRVIVAVPASTNRAAPAAESGAE